MFSRAYSSNRLLAAIPEVDAARIVQASQFVALPLRMQIFEADVRPRYLYLPTSGIVSLVLMSEQGRPVELATVGNEGLAGAQSLMGPQTSAVEGMMQVEGEGYRIPMAVAQEEFETCLPFRRRVLEFTQHQWILAEQIIACNRLHMAEARFARWLLMIEDRLQDNTLRTTQDFLAKMLSTRRTTVTEVSGLLQQAGAIVARRGEIRIVDRSKLAGIACSCYPVLKKSLDELYRK